MMPPKRIKPQATNNLFKRRRISQESLSEGKSFQTSSTISHSVPDVQLEEPSIEPSQAVSSRNLSIWRVKEIVGGEVYYIPEFVSDASTKEWLSVLADLDTWYHPKLKVYGREVSQSRSIAAYATDPKLNVKYSGHKVDLHLEYPPFLASIQKCVEDFLGEKFNYVMLNRYATGNEYIGKHRDTKENKIIASLSVGAERTFIMTPSEKRSNANAHKWTLASGSLVIMKGATQEKWKHEIPKEPKIKGERDRNLSEQLARALTVLAHIPVIP